MGLAGVARVVGMPCEDCEGAVDLFGENDANELMGQRHAAEGEYQVSARAHGSGPSIGWPNRKDERLLPAVPPQSNPPRQLFRADDLTPAIEGDEEWRGAAFCSIEVL